MSGNDLRIAIAGLVLVVIVIGSIILTIEHDTIPDFLITIGIAVATFLGVIGIGVATNNGKNGSTP